MRTVYILTFLLACLQTYSQESKSSIDKIRLVVEQINKDSGYSKKILNNEEFLEEATDGGGQLTGYFKNGQLVKIKEWIGLSSCINITEYYLQANKLIFTYTVGSDFAYDENSSTFNPQKQIRTIECRFYFENDILIKNIIKGQSRCSGKPKVEWSKNYLEECSRYQKLFRNK
jgi:hypothetical protein